MTTQTVEAPENEYMTIGACSWCGDEDVEIYKDTKRCEECDSKFTMCSICNEEQNEDNHCRHIFQGDDFEWRGSGAYMDPALKEPLFRLFDLMPWEFPADLRTAIRSGKFYTWLMAPMIGSGGILELNGIPLEREHDYGKRMIAIGHSEEGDESGDGYRWLVSLYEHETPKANALTIKWIDEYLRSVGWVGQRLS